MYIQSTNKRKQQRSTDKDTTSELKHSQPQTLENTSSKRVSYYSLYKHTNHTANVAQYTHTARKLISWKGSEEDMCF